MSGVEVLGLAASVVQIADLGARVSVKLFTYARKVKAANKDIDALSHEIAATGAVLQQLGARLSKDDQLRLCSQECIDTAKGLVKDCQNVFDELDKVIDIGSSKMTGKVGELNLSIKQRLKLPFVEPQIEQLRANLERLKSCLLLIVNVLILAEVLRNQEALPILKDQRELVRCLIDEKVVHEQRYKTILQAIDVQAQERVARSTCASNSAVALKYQMMETLDTTTTSNTPAVSNTSRELQDAADKSGVSTMNLPLGLKYQWEQIVHHSLLVKNILHEVNDLQYKLDYGIRDRMHKGVLAIHWEEWSELRRSHGHEFFLHLFEPSQELARFWIAKMAGESKGKTSQVDELDANANTEVNQKAVGLSDSIIGQATDLRKHTHQPIDELPRSSHGSTDPVGQRKFGVCGTDQDVQIQRSETTRLNEDSTNTTNPAIDFQRLPATPAQAIRNAELEVRRELERKRAEELQRLSAESGQALPQLDRWRRELSEERRRHEDSLQRLSAESGQALLQLDGWKRELSEERRRHEDRAQQERRSYENRVQQESRIRVLSELEGRREDRSTNTVLSGLGELIWSSEGNALRNPYDENNTEYERMTDAELQQEYQKTSQLVAPAQASSWISWPQFWFGGLALIGSGTATQGKICKKMQIMKAELKRRDLKRRRELFSGLQMGATSASMSADLSSITSGQQRRLDEVDEIMLRYTTLPWDKVVGCQLST